MKYQVYSWSWKWKVVCWFCFSSEYSARLRFCFKGWSKVNEICMYSCLNVIDYRPFLKKNLHISKVSHIWVPRISGWGNTPFLHLFIDMSSYKCTVFMQLVLTLMCQSFPWFGQNKVCKCFFKKKRGGKSHHSS